MGCAGAQAAGPGRPCSDQLGSPSPRAQLEGRHGSPLPKPPSMAVAGWVPPARGPRARIPWPPSVWMAWVWLLVCQSPSVRQGTLRRNLLPDSQEAPSRISVLSARVRGQRWLTPPPAPGARRGERRQLTSHPASPGAMSPLKRRKGPGLQGTRWTLGPVPGERPRGTRTLPSGHACPPPRPVPGREADGHPPRLGRAREGSGPLQPLSLPAFPSHRLPPTCSALNQNPRANKFRWKV